MPAYADALRAARTGQGRSLEDAAQMAGVRASYLEALERGDLDRKLSPGYVKSMLVRYGDSLGLNPDELLRAYDADGAHDADGTRPMVLAGPTRVYETRSHGRAAWRKRLPVALGVCVVAALVVVAVLELGLAGDWSLLSALGIRDARVAVATTVSTTPVAPQSTTPTAAAGSQAAAATTGTAAAKAPNLAGLLIQDERPPALPAAFTARLLPKQEVWLELTDAESGEVVFRGTRAKGDALNLELDGPVKAVVGRPGSLSVFFNGKSVKAPQTTLWLLSSQGVHSR